MKHQNENTLRRCVERVALALMSEQYSVLTRDGRERKVRLRTDQIVHRDLSRDLSRRVYM